MKELFISTGEVSATKPSLYHLTCKVYILPKLKTKSTM